MFQDTDTITKNGLHLLKSWLKRIIFPSTHKQEDNLIIAQITDTHITDTDAPYRGMPVRQQFLKVIRELASKPLDLLVISGDLAAVTGNQEIYLWIKQALANFPHPYVVMAGNHDDVEKMVTVFQLPKPWQGMLCFSQTIKGKHLFFLDSSSNKVSPEQLHWLTTQLAHYEESVLLFIHHPPILCDCIFMDSRYYLQNFEEVWQVLTQLPQIEHIFCGHYHTERTLIQDGKSVHLTPSTTFQINSTTLEFAIEHTRPGWRMIEWKDHRIETYVEYLPPED